MVTHLYLARHGETEWNRIKRLQGRLNSPLTKTGIEQAKQLANQIPQLNINRIIHSPLGRANHTAALCAERVNVHCSSDERLVERHFGDWQGQYFNDFKSLPEFSDVFLHCTETSPPNGESGVDCGNRLRHALEAIAKAHCGESILVITHGDMIRCFMNLMGRTAQVDAYSQFGNGQLFPLVYDDTQQQLRLT